MSDISDRARVLERIVAEIRQGEVTFPTHADVAFRVRLALDDPELHIASAAKVIQAEPLLAVRVVALANSVAFGRGIAVVDVRNAVARLGIKFVRALATALVMRQMAGGIKSPVFNALAIRLWEHTTHVAALASVLAGRFRCAAPDAALFAGIVHEVSGFYLISRTDAYPDLFADGVLITRDAESLVGRAVLDALSVPEEIKDAAETVWRGLPPVFPPQNLGDLLNLANALTPIASPLVSDDPAAPPALGAEASAVLAEVLEQSAEELGSLTAALRY
jgi:hypothetical protein